MNVTVSEDQMHGTVDGVRYRFQEEDFRGCDSCALWIAHRQRSINANEQDPCDYTKAPGQPGLSGLLPCVRYYRKDQRSGVWILDTPKRELHEDEGG